MLPRKLFINNTGYPVDGNLTVRRGDQPGANSSSVQFSIDATMGSQLTVDYGDAENIYVDQLEVSTLANGGYIVSNQLIVTRGSWLDDLFNTNDTISLAFQSLSFVITTSNTWTTSMLGDIAAQKPSPMP